MSAQHEIQRMLPRHYKILDLVLAGHGTAEIAQAVDMSPQAISLITNSSIFQHEVSQRRQSITKSVDEQLALAPVRAKALLDRNAEKAAQVHIDLLDEDKCPDPRVRQASANAILDRVFGDSKNQKSQVVMLDVGSINILNIALKETESLAG